MRSRRVRRVWPLARFTERESDGDRHIYLVLAGKSAEKIPLGWLVWKAQTYIREDNIKIFVKEVEWELWIRFIWLVMGNVFLTRKWTSGSRKVQGIPRFGYYGPDSQQWPILEHSTRAKRILVSYLLGYRQKRNHRLLHMRIPGRYVWRVQASGLQHNVVRSIVTNVSE